MYLKANNISHREELVNILDIFENNRSVQRIKLANLHSKSTLNLLKVTESEDKDILNLKSKKITRNGDISAKVSKKSIDIYMKEIT